jgi:hypothetical protein
VHSVCRRKLCIKRVERSVWCELTLCTDRNGPDWPRNHSLSGFRRRLKPHPNDDRGLMYVEGRRDASNRLAFCEQLRGNSRLIGIELARPSEVTPRCLAAFRPAAVRSPLSPARTAEFAVPRFSASTPSKNRSPPPAGRSFELGNLTFIPAPCGATPPLVKTCTVTNKLSQSCRSAVKRPFSGS